jgi:hypothetical protein
MQSNDTNRSWRLAVISLAMVLLPVLQGVFFATLGARSLFPIAAIILSVVSAAVGIAYLVSPRTRLFQLAIVLYLVQLGMFLAKLISTAPPLPLRLLQVAIVVCYLTSALAAALLAVPVLRRSYAFSLVFALGAALFIAEMSVDLPQPVQRSLTVPSQVVRAMTPDPQRGGANRQNATIRAHYRGNPKSSFQEADLRESQWRLRLAGGDEAQLILPADRPDDIRINITSAPSAQIYDIQLNQAGLRAQANASYALSFRARSDRPRTMFAGFARAHGDFNGLGYYSKIALTPEWRNVEEIFVPTADDDNARVFFDMGGNDAPIEVSAIHLRRMPEGTFIEPAVDPQQYAVDYRFNALGCRGPDYSIPKTSASKRILFLGNSYTLGEGVSEDAAVSRQLERLLNAQAPAYEVINCGASGYGTREERLFYETSAVKYQPDVVILGMTWKDDLSFWDLQRTGRLGQDPGKLAALFATWAKIQENRSAPDFSKSVEEVRQLDRDVRQHGGRLVVFLFRNNADYSGTTPSGKLWNRLGSSVSEGLQDSGIAILDLGKVLAKQSSDEDLTVHSPIGFELNETAHAVAARELAAFLRREGITP